MYDICIGDIIKNSNTGDIVADDSTVKFEKIKNVLNYDYLKVYGCFYSKFQLV